jgi:hypothetical protein
MQMDIVSASSRDILVNILGASITMGSSSLHFSMLSTYESMSVAELTFLLT